MIGGIEQTAHFFAFDLPHSDACYVRAYPAATAEAWADGHVHAFAFFGRVPLSVLYDNDRCLVARILADGTRRHLVLCQVERRPPRLDLDVYPYLPRARVGTTSASSYMSLMAGATA